MVYNSLQITAWLNAMACLGTLATSLTVYLVTSAWMVGWLHSRGFHVSYVTKALSLHLTVSGYRDFLCTEYCGAWHGNTLHQQ